MSDLPPIPPASASMAEDLAAAGTLLAHFLVRLPQGWNWVTRNDEDKGYFCNFMSPDFERVVVYSGGETRHEGGGQCYFAYGATLCDAVTDAASQIPPSAWLGEH